MELLYTTVVLTLPDLHKRVRVKHDETTLEIVFNGISSLRAFATEISGVLADAEDYLDVNPNVAHELEDLDGG